MTFKTLLASAVAVGALAAATPAHATQAWHSYDFWRWDGAYISAKGGYNSEPDQYFHDGVKSEQSSRYAGNVALGYQAAPGYRGEFEVGYLRADQDHVNSRDTGTVNANGDNKTLTLMANAYYDLNLAQLGVAPGYANYFTPYLGLGAGAAHVKFDDYRAGALTGSSANDGDWVFAYQAIAGAAINLTQNVSMTGEYRFFDTTNAEFHGQGARIRANEVLAGLKLKY